VSSDVLWIISCTPLTFSARAEETHFSLSQMMCSCPVHSCSYMLSVGDLSIGNVIPKVAVGVSSSVGREFAREVELEKVFAVPSWKVADRSWVCGEVRPRLQHLPREIGLSRRPVAVASSVERNGVEDEVHVGGMACSSFANGMLVVVWITGGRMCHLVDVCGDVLRDPGGRLENRADEGEVRHCATQCVLGICASGRIQRANLVGQASAEEGVQTSVVEDATEDDASRSLAESQWQESSRLVRHSAKHDGNLVESASLEGGRRGLSDERAVDGRCPRQLVNHVLPRVVQDKWRNTPVLISEERFPCEFAHAIQATRGEATADSGAEHVVLRLLIGESPELHQNGIRLHDSRSEVAVADCRRHREVSGD